MARSSVPIIVYCAFVLLFLLASLGIGNISTEGMRNLTNAYLTINAAIFAVAFAAIGINPNLNEPILKNFFIISVISSFGLFICIFSYFLSYISMIAPLTVSILFAVATIFTIISIFGIILTIQKFMPQEGTKTKPE
jgi:hypothetical protein